MTSHSEHSDCPHCGAIGPWDRQHGYCYECGYDENHDQAMYDAKDITLDYDDDGESFFNEFAR